MGAAQSSARRRLAGGGLAGLLRLVAARLSHIALLVSIAFNYTVGHLIEKTMERPRCKPRILTIGIAAICCCSVYYKYLFPLLHWLEQFGFQTGRRRTASVILPLGHLVFHFHPDRLPGRLQAGVTPCSRISRSYALFATFFPHLIAGPILHHRGDDAAVRGQEREYRLNAEDLLWASPCSSSGLGKKVLLADSFCTYGRPGFRTVMRIGDHRCLGRRCSPIHCSLYFDFSGYSDMAIGLARCSTSDSPLNFNSPYKSHQHHRLLAAVAHDPHPLSSHSNLYNPDGAVRSRDTAPSRGLTTGRAGHREPRRFRHPRGRADPRHHGV